MSRDERQARGGRARGAMILAGLATLAWVAVMVGSVLIVATHSKPHPVEMLQKDWGLPMSVRILSMSSVFCLPFSRGVCPADGY